MLNFLLFESHNLQGYINIKKEIEVQFTEVNKTNIYFAKKASGKYLEQQTNTLNIPVPNRPKLSCFYFFVSHLKIRGIPFYKSNALIKSIQNQVKKIIKTIQMLHEDLQYDYLKMMEELNK